MFVIEITDQETSIARDLHEALTSEFSQIQNPKLKGRGNTGMSVEITAIKKKKKFFIAL
jgi:hypothetical protein